MPLIRTIVAVEEGLTLHPTTTPELDPNMVGSSLECGDHFYPSPLPPDVTQVFIDMFNDPDTTGMLLWEYAGICECVNI
tara:strand:+ start:90 stop:326 length:237 start_codon:yes stop_codon:yes gene_type:complete